MGYGGGFLSGLGAFAGGLSKGWDEREKQERERYLFERQKKQDADEDALSAQLKTGPKVGDVVGGTKVATQDFGSSDEANAALQGARTKLPVAVANAPSEIVPQLNTDEILRGMPTLSIGKGGKATVVPPKAAAPAPNPAAKVPDRGYGQRYQDDTERLSPYDTPTKGNGYYGLLPRADGTRNKSSELSIGVDVGGKRYNVPTMVPGLNQQQINYLLSTPEDQLFKRDPAMMQGIQDNATKWAQQRIDAKLPVYATGSEEGQYKPSTPASAGAPPARNVPTYGEKYLTGDNDFGVDLNKAAVFYDPLSKRWKVTDEANAHKATQFDVDMHNAAIYAAAGPRYVAQAAQLRQSAYQTFDAERKRNSEVALDTFNEQVTKGGSLNDALSAVSQLKTGDGNRILMGAHFSTQKQADGSSVLMVSPDGINPPHPVPGVQPGTDAQLASQVRAMLSDPTGTSLAGIQKNIFDEKTELMRTAIQQGHLDVAKGQLALSTREAAQRNALGYAELAERRADRRQRAAAEDPQKARLVTIGNDAEGNPIQQMQRFRKDGSGYEVQVGNLWVPPIWSNAPKSLDAAVRHAHEKGWQLQFGPDQMAYGLDSSGQRHKLNVTGINLPSQIK